MTRLDGARVLVTGASSGIGRAVALRCAAAGAELVLSGRDETRLVEVATATGGTAVTADLSRPGAAAELAGLAGPVDVLVCCAGAGLAGPFGSDGAGLDALVRLNFTATVELVRSVLGTMRSSGRGHVVVVSSVAGRLPVRDEVVYGATKAAVDHFAAALRTELRGSGVGISAVAPAGVDTPFFDRRGTPYRRTRPRLLRPEKVADAVVAAIERDLPEVVVPRWLRLAYVIRALLPRLYDRLSHRLD
ncbi:MAG: SDR family NAD(P)-dependent oxidoreductase [Streptosporangiales bacterium]|nr:SDR family NAD(P)-dependent oxidoreductase [Streptosporangiales bacterium]MBO0890686.1 SDR family NAD(P)-dependent oxidoreductase [Acidothermales bacterium]